MTENLNSAVQVAPDTQRLDDGASAATGLAKPNVALPRSLSKKHASDGVRPAKSVTKPTGDSPGTSSTKRGRKIARAASMKTQPNTEAPPTSSKKHSRKAVSPARDQAKPTLVPPGIPSPKRGRQSNGDNLVRPATARPAICSAQPIKGQPGDSLSGDLRANARQEKVASARRSKHQPKPILKVSGVNSEGHFCIDNQKLNALDGRANSASKSRKMKPDHSLRDGHLKCDSQNQSAAAGDDQCRNETHNGSVIAQIQELWRRRQSWHRTEKSLTLQCSGICRRTVGACGIVMGMNKKETTANKLLLKKAAAMLERIEEGAAIAGDENAAISCLPILAGREPLREERKAVEKTLGKAVRTLPIWKWAEPIPGIAELSIYSVIGECGDVGSYKSASAVWKRMGLAVINGERQRRVLGPDALLHGYSPQRHSVAWNIGGCLIGGMGRGPRPKIGEDVESRDDWSTYQRTFVKLLRAEVERVTETWDGPAHKRKPVERDGELYESFSSHAANRIKRRIVKQFLAEMYDAWRKTGRAN